MQSLVFLSKNFGNSRGETLIAVMVAAAIGVLVVSLITSSLVDVFKSQRAISATIASRDIVLDIRQLLADTATCKKNFSGQDPSGDGFSNNTIVDKAGSIRYNSQGGTTYGGGLIAFAGFQVKNLVPNPAVTNSGTADLYLQILRTGSIIGPSQMGPGASTIKLMVIYDSNNKILSCNSFVGTDSFWKQSPANSADIYYGDGNVGNVGINTKTPIFPLQVNGTLVAGVGKQATTLATDIQVIFDTNPGTIVSAFSSGYAAVLGQDSTSKQTGLGISSGNQKLAAFYANANGGAVMQSYSGNDVLLAATDNNNIIKGSLRISGNSGNIGIGKDPTSNKLEVDGKVAAKGFLYTSDRRLKKNIQDIPDVLERVRSLHGIQFQWKNSSKINLGFIAQDVEKVFPEVVSTSATTGLKSVEYGNLVAPLIEAINLQQTQIYELKKEIELLKARK